MNTNSVSPAVDVARPASPTNYDNSEPGAWGFATRQIHVGHVVDSDAHARGLPIHQSASFVFPDSRTGAALFDLAEVGYTYSRTTNPTVEAVEKRITSLEGGVHTVLFSSGMAAIHAALVTLTAAGSHVVASPRLYGGTVTLLTSTLARFGVRTTFVDDPDDPGSWSAAAEPETVAFFGETIGNPLADILDIPAVADAAHAHGVPLIVDNTLATPALVRPIELGADIVVNSTTKFLTGNSSYVGGALTDGGTFDWNVRRDGRPVFPTLSEPDPTYHGLVFTEAFGPEAFAIRARTGVLRDTGGCQSAQAAWQLAQGLDTLDLRVARHNDSAAAIARYLAGRPEVVKVNHAGLSGSPWHPVKERLGLDGAGSVFSFDIDGGREDAWAFIDALRLFSNLVNVGDVRSLVVHPNSTTHRQGTPEANAAAGITDSTIRLSIGLEDVADLIDDLDRGFRTLAERHTGRG